MAHDDSFNKTPSLGDDLGLSLDSGPGYKARFDMGKYMAMFDDATLSDAQKKQMIGALIDFGVAFYDLGFGVEFAWNGCGKLAQIDDESDDDAPDVVRMQVKTLTDTFNNFAAE